MALQDTVYGDGFDGFPDNVCDDGLPSQPDDALDYAKALGLCAETTADSHDWGVISATFTRADGSGTPAAVTRSVRPEFGVNAALSGTALVVFATGPAAAPGQMDPAHVAFQPGASTGVQGTPPADWLAAHGGALPSPPECPASAGAAAVDPVMLTLDVRVPGNARSFDFAMNYLSSEFPEWVCSPFSDFFVALLDSSYAGTPANPVDKNIATLLAPSSSYPMSANFVHGGTHLFTQCVSGATGCAAGAVAGDATCDGTLGITGTGMDLADPGTCTSNGMVGGGTGWMRVRANVVPGETIRLRLAIWDTGDSGFDSFVLLDDFRWSATTVVPGGVPASP
ncbi:MAG TPA: choice-of-anchor L domain-containing protein [Dokdonella sp.]|nr:choice-of-anchor L domain-containing protein [Dokdonella sp.]